MMIGTSGVSTSLPSAVALGDAAPTDSVGQVLTQTTPVAGEGVSFMAFMLELLSMAQDSSDNAAPVQKKPKEPNQTPTGAFPLVATVSAEIESPTVMPSDPAKAQTDSTQAVATTPGQTVLDTIDSGGKQANSKSD